MGRIVVGEENLLPELVRLGKMEGYIPGLIIGQCSGQKDFIVHLAKTPLPTEKVNKLGNDLSGDCRMLQKKSLGKLNEIHESWLVDHAKQVTRMLPGGVWILGLFITGPGDPFADSAAQAKLASLLQSLSKALGCNPSLYGDSPSNEKLALHLVSGTNKFVCKSYDVSSTSTQFRGTDCKFSGELKWHQLDTQYDFDLQPPLLITNEAVKEALKVNMQGILDIFKAGVLKSICVIDGEVKKSDDTLEELDGSKNSKQNKSPESKIFQVNLYIPRDEDSTDLKVTLIAEEMKCTGVLASRVFLHQKATFAEAFKAIKEDIIRSFAARVEMHCDSLVEEEIGSPDEVVVVHEPPRRVLIPLPHSQVALSDYLFPGEGPSEALLSIQDLISVRIPETAVCQDFEGQPDQCDLYNLTTPNSDVTKEEEGSSSVSASNHSIFMYAAIALSFLVLAVSLFIQFYMK